MNKIEQIEKQEEKNTTNTYFKKKTYLIAILSNKEELIIVFLRCATLVIYDANSLKRVKKFLVRQTLQMYLLSSQQNNIYLQTQENYALINKHKC